MTRFVTHGRILGGTVATADLDAALVDYRDYLGLVVGEQGRLPPDLAQSWGARALAGARYAVLRPQGAESSFLRLVEQPVPAAFRPTTTYGWAAFEISVQNVFDWPDRLAGSGFDVVGPPREIPGLPYFVAMQMLGRGREMLYLNEVRSDTPISDLPRAAAPIDRVFIVILATPDSAATMAWYQDRLGFEEGARYTIPYTMINQAFGLPLDTLHDLSMAQRGRMPIIEIDSYPAAATARGRAAGYLPPGNAVVTLAVDTLDRPGLSFVTPPVRRDGRRTASVIGPAGEIVELVEIG